MERDGRLGVGDGRLEEMVASSDGDRRLKLLDEGMQRGGGSLRAEKLDRAEEIRLWALFFLVLASSK
jgi:hypothetical protein